MYLNNINQTTNSFEHISNRTAQNYSENDNLYISFNDDNGKVEMTDFEYSSPEAKKLAQSYLKGLKPYCDGKHKWTQALLDLKNNLINIFNREHSAAYDSTNDEIVKDTTSAILYDKNGRALSTSLKTPYDTFIVTYKYYKNGEIDSATYKDDYTYEYRKNGTRFSKVSYNPQQDKEIIRYNFEGKKSFQKIEGENYITEITYDDNENIIKHFYKDNKYGCQKIYLNNSPVLTTLYDSKGRVKKYIDDYFKKNGRDTVLQGYLSTTTIHSNDSYNTLYQQAPIKGKITERIKQGTSGTCYAAGIINSFVLIPAGRRLLDNTLPNDGSTKECVVTFKGLSQTYTLPAEEISKNMSRLGRKSGDYSGMILAYEKFRESGALFNGTKNLPDCFYKEHRGADDRRIDGGNPAEFFYALTGKEMNESSSKITDLDIQKARQCLATGKGVVNAGTVIEEDKNNEIPESDREKGIVPNHNLSVVNIRATYVTLYDSVTEQETIYPIDKFKKYFSKLYWGTVD